VRSPTQQSASPGASLTKFQLRILAILGAADGAPKGLAVKERLEAYYGQDVNHGRLYPNLDELVDAGYVAKGTKDLRTNSYQLTDQGRDVLRAEVRWLNTHTFDNRGDA